MANEIPKIIMSENFFKPKSDFSLTDNVKPKSDFSLTDNNVAKSLEEISVFNNK